MNIEQKINDILFELSGENIFTSDTQLQEKLALDSLSMVMLIINIEDAFDIQLDEADMNPLELKTVQNIIDLVKKYTGDNYE